MKKFLSKRKQRVRLIMESGYFDPAWYLRRYGSVKCTKDRAAQHYLDHGWRKGYDPSSKFSTLYYLNSNRGKIPNGINPLIHYITDGKSSGCKIAPAVEPPKRWQLFRWLWCAYEVMSIKRSGRFATDWYIDHYEDFREWRFKTLGYRIAKALHLEPVARYFASPIRHYVYWGIYEGRFPTPRFNTYAYFAHHPELIKKRINPFYYAIKELPDITRPVNYPALCREFNVSQEDYELIATSDLFDPVWYWAKYPTVAASRMPPIIHYLKIGYKDGCRTSAKFNGVIYWKLNPDLAKERKNPLVHYLRYGRKEGRRISERGCEAYSLKKIKNKIIGRIKLWKNERLIRNSEYFDVEWYLNENPNVKANGINPYRHYLTTGWRSGRSPSRDFVEDEYLSVNFDVKAYHGASLVHYEKFGKKEGRPISWLQVSEPQFPDEAISGERVYKINPPQFKRVAIFASYTGNGIVSEHVLYYLRGIKKVADNIVFVADNPLFETELNKFEGLVSCAYYERHGEYDFGSYKRGMRLARRLGLLEPDICDELLIVNDSCYGPVFPLAGIIEKMDARECDFWGLTQYSWFGHRHIQSFFYCFNAHIVHSKALDRFLEANAIYHNRGQVVEYCEMKLTNYLQSLGYKYDTVMPFGKVKGPPSKFPITAISRYGVPIIKAKAALGDSYENVEKARKYLRHINPELESLIRWGHVESKRFRISEDDFQASFKEKEIKIRYKVLLGDKIKVVFLVTMPQMFGAKPLADAMLKDSSFEIKVAAVPDVRWGSVKMFTMLEESRNYLCEAYGCDRTIHVEADEFGEWPDVLNAADIVVYSTPYSISSFRYNPQYAVGRNFLPVMVDYGYYRSVYDKTIVSGQNYAYMWKILAANEDVVNLYRECAVLKDRNVDLTGYVKMDEYASIINRDLIDEGVGQRRKTILIAPHHSVDGGVNNTLALSNFQQYSEYFLELPQRHPELNFIFRPHPFLFTILSASTLWGSHRVKSYIEKMRSMPNVRWSSGAYFEDFAASDGAIQDCGSYLVEYFYTGKPCCYMLKDPSDIESKFLKLGRDCLDNCYVAYNEDAIEEFITDVIARGNDPKKEARERFAKERVMINYPKASEVAIEHIKRDLGLQEGRKVETP